MSLGPVVRDENFIVEFCWMKVWNSGDVWIVVKF